MRRRFLDVLHYPWSQIRRFVLVNMLHANDPPHQLALGAAIGVFVAVTPTVGVQMGVVLLLAWLLGANKVVGLPIVWVTNPATIVPIYYSCYFVGRRLLGMEGIGREWWAELKGSHDFSFYWTKLMDVATPLWVGCLVCGFALAYPTYHITYVVVRRYRMRRWGQLTPPDHEVGEAALLLDNPPNPAEGSEPPDVRPEANTALRD